MRVSDVAGIPVGVVGRVSSGPNSGLYIEVDDDTVRPKGTGGYYVVLWDASEGYDEWYETADALRASFDYRTVDWFTPEQSAAIPGRHSHGTGA